MRDTVKQAFGGPWTIQKLGCVESYLQGWARVMKNQTQWRTRYIDAFSGTGKCALRGAPSPDMEGVFDLGLDLDALEEQGEVLDGSVRKALEIVPPFDRLDLIEMDPAKVAELRSLQPSHAGQKIEVHEDDANAALLRLCQGFDSLRERGVLFLDPFGCQSNGKPSARLPPPKRSMSGTYFLPAGSIGC